MANNPAQRPVFNITDLRDKIGRIRRKVHQLRGHKALCLRPIDRLAALCEVLAELDDARREPVEKSFADAVAAYRNAISWQMHYPWLLYWIATGQRLMGQVRNSHMRISAIYAALGTDEDPMLANAWSSRWDAEYREFVRWLIEQSEQFNAVQFRAQVADNPIKIREFLATIKLQLDVYGALDHDMETQDHDMDRGDRIVSAEMIALMKNTLDKLTVDSKVDPGDIFPWYIPKEDVTYDAKTSFGKGSFGELFLGKWTRSEDPVGVKIVEETGDDGAAFSQEFNVWSQHRHPNILTMYGANHLAEKKFFVCELAGNGNLDIYFQDGNNRELLWNKFRQAAEGLKFLHTYNVQHGGIKISNLLLAADGVVKLSDFGLSVVRDQSKTMSKRPKEDGARWKAPEELTERDVSSNYLKADVYSLGLCVIEAVTNAIPFAEMDDKEVFESKRDNAPVERPPGFSDEEWQLVARMVHNDPNERPTAAELVDLISSMVPAGDFQDADRPPSEVGHQGGCAACGWQNPAAYQFCAHCGHWLA